MRRRTRISLSFRKDAVTACGCGAPGRQVWGRRVDGDAPAAVLIRECGARIAALARLVGQHTASVHSEEWIAPSPGARPYPPIRATGVVQPLATAARIASITARLRAPSSALTKPASPVRTASIRWRICCW